MKTQLTLLPFALAFMAVVVPLSASAQEVAKMYSVEGSVDERKGASGAWAPAAATAVFASGDAVRTGDGSRAAFINVEGIMVRLNANSAVEFKDQTGGVAVNGGDAHFLSRDPHSAPSVTTSIVSGSVRGTEFAVSVKPDQVVFSVINGQVALANEFGQVTLASGEEGVTNRGRAPTKRIMVRPFDAVQWTIRYPALVSLADLRPYFEAGSSNELSGFSAILTGDYANAEKLLVGKSERAVLGRALLAWQRRGIPEALAALEGRSSTAASQLFRAGLFLESGQVSPAQSIHEALKTAHLTQELNAILLSQQAVVAIAQNHAEDAASKAKLALEANPRCVQALFARSLVEQSGGGIEQASASVKEAMQLDTRNSRLTARAAELAFGAGDAIGAARLAEESMGEDPDDADARSLRGFILLARGEVENARAEFNLALAARSPPATAHLGLGIATIRAGDKEAGRIEIQKAVQLEPTNSMFRSYLGKALFESNRLGTAEEELNTAKRLDPLDPTPYLYDAFNKLATFRPVEALDAIEDSIERNENRFVYRSKFMLDKDQATRAVGLGRVFATLDFVQPARIAALRSLAEDPTNYSAHFLLKDTLIGSNADAAITVEDVTASLLAPSTFSSILATASGAASLNDYTTLFEQAQSRSTFDVVAQSKERGFDTSVAHFSGGDKHSYLLRYGTTYLNGYRDDDYQRTHTGRFVAAYDVSPDDKLLLEGIGITSDTGDTSIGFDPQFNDPNIDTRFGDVIARLGYRHTFDVGSEFLSQLAYVDSTFKFYDAESSRNFPILFTENGEAVNGVQSGASFDSRSETHTHGFRGDAQQLWNSEYLSLTSGAGFVSFTQTQNNSSFTAADDAGILQNLELTSRADTSANAGRAYSYLTIKPDRWLRITGGSNYTALQQGVSDQEPYVDRERNITDWNPRAGIMVYPGANFTIRSAYFEQLGGASARDLETLEPAQVSGIRTLFVDAPGVKSRNWGSGLDWKLPKSTYIGAEFLHRRLDQSSTSAIDVLSIDQLGQLSAEIEDQSTHSYQTEQNVTAYAQQVLSNQLVASFEYDWIQRNDDISDVQVRTHKNRLGLNYFHPSGFFSFGSATWRHQDLDNYFQAGQTESSSFWIMSGGIGWQVPERHGAVQLAVRNAFDQSFVYEPTSTDTSVFPGTDIVLSANLNF